MTAPSATTAPRGAGESDSTWGLLRSGAFRAVWFGALFSNIGGLMHETAAVWTMAGLVASPLWISLMQTAMSLPLFLLGVPAGALGDLFSPRRVLVRSESFLAAVTLGLGGVAVFGVLSPSLLLAATLLIGLGTAFSLPAWQSLLPELVRREEIPAAVALNGLSLNIARALGPALGGLVLAASGPAACFVLNGLSYAVIVWVLWRGRSSEPTREPSGEPFWPAMVAGARYVRHSPLLRLVMIRMAAFVFPAAGVVALFPVLARRDWNLGAAGFGAFMAAYGLGAVVAATWLPRLRSRLSLRGILSIAGAAYAVFGLGLALGPGGWAMLALMPIGGAGWICSISTLNASAQAAAAPWVRGRALAFNLLCFQGGLAFGALLWGAAAATFGVTTTILAAVAALGVGLVAMHGRDLEAVKALDLAPAGQWPEPVASLRPGEESRPATITVDYVVDPARREAFLAALRTLGRARLRTGAVRWELIEDANAPGTFQERFTLASWEEHLRQHRRVSRSDHADEARVDGFHLGPGSPPVRHWIHPRGASPGSA